MTATTLELPALDGRLPLGFLAALGMLRLLHQERHIPARLSFSDTTANALLHSPLTSIDQVVAELTAVVDSIEPGAVLPGVDAQFPPPAAGGKDPLRWTQADYRKRAEEWRETHPYAAAVWLPCLTTDLAVDSQGRGAISPFIAPSGQQKLRTFFEKPLDAVRANSAFLHQALTRWRRIDGFTGEYLDHHVLRGAADDPQGRTGQEAGVPGATWLATMSLPFFHLSGDGQKVRSTLWHRVARDHVAVWPLWHPPLDTEAVRSLLENPAFAPDATFTVKTRDWAALGVFSVHAAHRHRITGRTFDGVLTPCPIYTS